MYDDNSPVCVKDLSTPWHTLYPLQFRNVHIYVNIDIEIDLDPLSWCHTVLSKLSQYHEVFGMIFPEIGRSFSSVNTLRRDRAVL